MILIRKPVVDEKAAESDEHRFTRLMKDSTDFAYQVARRFFEDQEEIKDAVQSAYIKAWRAFQSYSEKKSLFTTWYFSILRNECLDRIRKNSKIYEEDINRHPNLSSNSPAEDLENKELYKNIILLAERLPRRQKEVFILRDIQGFAVKEVAGKTGQSEGSTKTNLYLARKKMRTWIIEENLI